MTSTIPPLNTLGFSPAGEPVLYYHLDVQSTTPALVYILYREGLEKENLSVYLVSLCKSFYEGRREPALLRRSFGSIETSPGHDKSVTVFQCKHCLTLYDEQYGDPDAGEPAGRPFGQTSSGYTCPVCGSGKEDFIPVEKTALLEPLGAARPKDK